ncbi:homoserine O-acetyltransferase domain protein [Mycobacterium xenopi 3993]|nr:homoserine O-acetyltransferase domain protein [Mycobacterium xenopi 3993]
MRDQVEADVAALAHWASPRSPRFWAGRWEGRGSGMDREPPDQVDRRCCWRSARGHRRPNRHPEHPDCGYQGRPELAGR